MTKEQKQAYIAAIQAIADAIKALGTVPSGHLYARLMGKMSLETYNGFIGLLKEAGLVKEENYLLIWIGEQK